MVYRPKDVDDNSSSFSFLLHDPQFYYDDDSCINYADDSYNNCDDDSCIIDDDSYEFNKTPEDLYDTFNNGSDNEHLAKEDTPTPADSSTVGFLEIAKSTVGVIGEKSVGFLEMAKSTVGVIGERSGGFLETAKTVGVVGGTAIAAGWSLYCLLSSSDASPSPFPSSSSTEKEKKKMKAPGRKGEYIFREPFEDNPRQYYRQLRHNKRMQRNM